MAGYHACPGFAGGERRGRKAGPIPGALAAMSGFTMVEVLVVLTLISVGVAFGAGFMGVQAHRMRLVGAAREIRTLLWQARSEAVSTGRPIVVQFNAVAGQITVFQDYSANVALPHVGVMATQDGNGVQNTYTPATDNEPTLHTYTLPPRVLFRRPAGAVGDAASIAFDGCIPAVGVAPVDDRVIFLSDGSSIAPGAGNSLPPSVASDGTYTCTSCKGIFLTDTVGTDYFRVSVDDAGIGGKVNLLKYLSTAGLTTKYGQQPWRWN